MPPRRRTKLSERTAYGGEARRLARRKSNIDTDQRRGFFGDLGQMGGDLKELPPVQDARDMWRDLSGSVKGLPIVKDARQMYGDLIRDPIKQGLAGLKLPSWMMMDSVTQNLAQNEENERILGDAYSDDVRKKMMSPSDRAFYEKYMRIGDSKSGQEADYYYDEARKALENAQTTRRVNYALGDQPFGFDTSAEAGTHNVDYGGLSDRLQSGLEGTKSGREFLSDVIPKGEALRDTGMIGDAAARIARAQEEGRA